MPKQVWQAEDGTQFENEKDCLLYEKFSKELCKRAIPQEIRNLPNGETSHSIAKNFYSILSSVHEIVSFLESVELIVAPNEKMIRERKEKEKQKNRNSKRNPRPGTKKEKKKRKEIENAT